MFFYHSSERNSLVLIHVAFLVAIHKRWWKCKKNPEGWQHASMGQLPGDWGLAPVSEWSWHHWVVTTWSENRTEKSETENHRSASACAMLFLLAGGDDNSFTSGMDLVLVKQSHLRFRLHSMSPRCSTAFSVKVPLSCWLLSWDTESWDD